MRRPDPSVVVVWVLAFLVGIGFWVGVIAWLLHHGV